MDFDALRLSQMSEDPDFCESQGCEYDFKELHDEAADAYAGLQEVRRALAHNDQERDLYIRSLQRRAELLSLIYLRR